MLSAIIPTLNAAAGLPSCIGALGAVEDIVVADGGSADGTVAVAQRLGARVIAAPRGRGQQLAAGADAAVAGGADWLLFVHADTVLGPGWQSDAEAHMRTRPDVAAFFRLGFDDASAGARRVAGLANWRARMLGLPYGDQGLLISAELYRRVGGFAPLPLMEDVDMARRLSRRHMVALSATAVTSAARYRRDGWWLRPARNLVLLSLFLAGVPANRLAAWYTR